MIQTRTAHSTSTENGSLQPPTRGASKPKANGQSSSFLRSPSASSSQSPAASTWSHTPTTVTLLWLVFSLPLVVWDFIYCLGRPWTMPGGSWHWPLYVPYELYGKIDYIYGWPAFDQRNGFTSAQAVLNVAETAMYAYYLYIYCASARGAEGKWWQAGRRIEGRLGGFAALLGLSAAVMTCSKTVLYWLNEYYSGFSHIGHNPFGDLFILWIIPNGAWLVMSAYMTFVIGEDLLNGLEMAAAHAKDE